MDALQQAVNAHVQIGVVYRTTEAFDTQMCAVWNELWHLVELVRGEIDVWASLEYYYAILRETHERMMSTAGDYWQDEDAVQRDFDLLTEAIAEFCPPGVYFGVDPDMLTNRGFYPEHWRGE